MEATDYFENANSQDDSVRFYKLNLWFQSTHKGQTTCCCFSSDGQLSATGSSDTSLKVIDVEKIKSRGSTSDEDFKPVIRTYYDHQAPVNEVTFHPNGLILASASDDGTIKLFDIGKGAHAKRGFRGIVDGYPVKSISFHPSGDFLLSGTTMPAPRLYDVRTNQAFRLQLPPNENSIPFDQSSALCKVQFDSTGRLFATGDASGNVHIHDGVSGRLIQTLSVPSRPAAITSLQFTANSKYVLAACANGSAFLWNWSQRAIVVTYSGLASGQYNSVVFSCDEKLVFGTDTSANAINQQFSTNLASNIVQYSSLNGKVLNRAFAHNGAICMLASHPNETAILSGGSDRWAKFWAPEKM